MLFASCFIDKTWAQANLKFIPIVPCRVVDTRPNTANEYTPAMSGPFGSPALAAVAERTYIFSSSPQCSSRWAGKTPKAYALNVTLVNLNFPGSLGPSVANIVVWPTGSQPPLATALVNPPGRLVSNNMIIGTGAGGAISVMSSDATHLLIDVNGYFADDPSGMAFYPMTPCRVVDTRAGITLPVLKAPSYPQIPADSERSFPLDQQNNCSFPSGVPIQAFALNVTVVPPTGQPVGFVTAFPSGAARPTVSLMNVLDGRVAANGAIVKTGSFNGSSRAVTVYSNSTTDVVIDVTGYFAPPGSFGGLVFSPVTPCRAVSDATLTSPPLGFPATKIYSIAGNCTPPANTGAYAISTRVNPAGLLGFVTVWPTGQGQPIVSLLNAVDGNPTANGAIIPAGNSGQLSFYATEPLSAATNPPRPLTMDVTGYFVPEGAPASGYDGLLSRVSCSRASGFALDKANAANNLTVSLYDNGSPIPFQAGSASMTGHGFAIPMNFSSGSHSITAKVGGWTVPGGPKNLTCGTSQGLPFPSAAEGWKGLHYFPVGHPRWRMPYNWYVGAGLENTVAADLDALAASGFNMIHLYLWDKGSLGNDPAGFAYPNLPTSDPDQSSSYVPDPRGQFNAVNRLIGLAEERGLFVTLTFVNEGLRSATVNSSNAVAKADEFVDWADTFINRYTQDHSNIVSWGNLWEHTPVGDIASPVYDASHKDNILWRKIYRGLKAKATAAATAYGRQPASISVELPLGQFSINAPGLVARGSGYNWAATQTKTLADIMKDTLTEEYNQVPTSPDIFRLQLYNANSQDLRGALLTLFSGNVVTPDNSYVIEFGTGSSLAPGANGIITAGDKQVTTTTLEGQAQWIRNAYCMMGRLGIRKTAYWSAADEYSLWSDQYWKYSPRDLAWHGYWGLRDETGALKPIATALSDIHMKGLEPWCPQNGAASALPLILSLQADSGSFAVQGTKIPLSWGAMEFTSMSFSPSPELPLNVYNCGDRKKYVSSNLDVSCGLTYFAPSSPGTQTITLTASNGTNLSAPVTVDVGLAPSVYSLQNIQTVPSAPLPINRNSRVRITGRGFTPGSRINIQAGFINYEFYDGDGKTRNGIPLANGGVLSTLFKIDQQVGVEFGLDGVIPAGTWNLTVTTNDSTVTPKPTSNSVPITIVP
jgi:hypothetical protein